MQKALDAVQLVAFRDGITTRELGQALGLTRSTAHRLVASLVSVRLIQPNAANDGYILGPVVDELAQARGNWQMLRNLCRPHLVRLRDLTGETTALHVLSGDRRVLLEQAESLNQHRWVYSNPLVPMPLHAGAAAKMLLSLLPGPRIKAILKRDGLVAFTSNTPRDAEQLVSELERIAAEGCAVSQQEVSPGISSIAIPLFSARDSHWPVAALSVTGPAMRLTETVLLEALPALRKTAAEIAHEASRAVCGESQVA